VPAGLENAHKPGLLQQAAAHHCKASTKRQKSHVHLFLKRNDKIQKIVRLKIAHGHRLNRQKLDFVHRSVAV
jgi:hypothetical protein